jgi:excisionase family DNA binding protein
MNRENGRKGRVTQGRNPDEGPGTPEAVSPLGAAFLTPAQVAEALACSKDLVLDIIHRGELPAVMISKSARSRKPLYRVAPADLRRFVEARRVQPAPKRLPKRPAYTRWV